MLLLLPDFAPLGFDLDPGAWFGPPGLDFVPQGLISTPRAWFRPSNFSTDFVHNFQINLVSFLDPFGSYFLDLILNPFWSHTSHNKGTTRKYIGTWLFSGPKWVSTLCFLVFFLDTFLDVVCCIISDLILDTVLDHFGTPTLTKWGYHEK